MDGPQRMADEALRQLTSGRGREIRNKHQIGKIMMNSDESNKGNREQRGT